MMRVLVICQEDPERILGGMGTHVREHYRAMARRSDVEIDLVTMGPGESKKYLGYTKHTADKLVCYKPNNPGMSTLLISDIQMLKTVMRLYREGKRWDVVHCHEWNSLQVGWAVRDAFGLPLVSTMHLCITKLSEDGWLRSTCKNQELPPEDDVYLMNQEGRLIVESDELILCSQAYAEMTREVFMTDRDINVIYNGIRTDEWHPDSGNPMRAWSSLSLPKRPICLFVGRIADMKGINELLDAVEKQDTGYCTVLCGEVNANNDAQKENWCVTKRIRGIEATMPDRLRWIGFHSGQFLKDIYSMADVCIMPSVHEPFGIVALEAMAMGIPLISTEVDGLGEIVVDPSGNEYSLIIEPGSSDAILKALELLRDNKTDKQTLSGLGLQRARQFDWTEIADQTVNVYSKLLRRFKKCLSC